MTKLRNAVASLLIALALFINVSKAEDGALDEEEKAADAEQPKTPAYDDSHEIAELNQRRRAHMQHLVRERAEAYRAEAERKRKLAAEKSLVSRSKPYEGKPQTYEATAYTAYCAGCSGITADGHDLRKTIYKDGRRVIATDPRYVPLGSIVRVTLADGTSFEAVASDTGGRIKGQIIDIAHETTAEALQFGRQTVEIRMIKRGGR